MTFSRTCGSDAAWVAAVLMIDAALGAVAAGQVQVDTSDQDTLDQVAQRQFRFAETQQLALDTGGEPLDRREVQRALVAERGSKARARQSGRFGQIVERSAGEAMRPKTLGARPSASSGSKLRGRPRTLVDIFMPTRK